MNNNDKMIQAQYAEEAKRRWGDSEAYKEYERRIADDTQEDRDALRDGMESIIDGFAKLNASGTAPDHEEPRLQVKKLQKFIDEHLYHCTDEILSGLGELYVSDKRFTENIDKHGEGTAAYIAACIRSYLADR